MFCTIRHLPIDINAHRNHPHHITFLPTSPLSPHISVLLQQPLTSTTTPKQIVMVLSQLGCQRVFQASRPIFKGARARVRKPKVIDKVVEEN